MAASLGPHLRIDDVDHVTPSYVLDGFCSSAKIGRYEPISSLGTRDDKSQLQCFDVVLPFKLPVDGYENVKLRLGVSQQGTVFAAAPTGLATVLTACPGKAAFTPMFTYSSRRIRTRADYLWPVR
jgi:hypothetical protein